MITDYKLALDVMSGERDPHASIDAAIQALENDDALKFYLVGDEKKILDHFPRELMQRIEIIHTDEVVSMEESPVDALRKKKNSSMRLSVNLVSEGKADACVSSGNTGALMALSVIRLRKLPGVNRPAIAILWPSNNPQGFNVMLDVGADIRADARDLLQYALMGASYARTGLALARPRVGLLNVGTEDNKGRPELREAHALISRNAEDHDFSFVGFVEGGDIPGIKTDVIITDGFTGNVALKTGEGTASLISDLLREAFKYTPLSRLASLLALTSLRRLKKRIDPRRVNGGVFLGLNGTVVKSHGGADATGVSAAVKLAVQLAESRFAERLAARVASAATLTQDTAKSTEVDAKEKEQRQAPE